MAGKTLYHSELSKLGIVNVRINNEPTESKYPGKPKWVSLEINGEERFYNCENDECELALTGHRNDWVELEAHGSREEAAIRVEVIEKPAQRENAREQIAAAKAKIAAMPDDRPSDTPDEKPRPAQAQPKAEQPELTPAHVEQESESRKIANLAAYSGKVFAVAWEESKNAMALIPTKDATELTAYEWLDLRLRITNHHCIEIQKIIRKERF